MINPIFEYNKKTIQSCNIKKDENKNFKDKSFNIRKEKSSNYLKNDIKNDTFEKKTNKDKKTTKQPAKTTYWDYYDVIYLGM